MSPESANPPGPGAAERSSLRGALVRIGTLLVAPFLVLAPYTFSFHHHHIRIGNDFRIDYYNYKAYLLDFLSHGRIPWWSPSEAAGYPFFSNPYAQVFYPLNAVLAVWVRLTGGYTALDHQRYTVFALSLLSVGLYLWLRSLRFGTRPAFYAAFVAGLSFKATELVRFPNAIHTAAWIPWTLFGITSIHVARSSGRKALHAAGLAFYVICLVTGGYPYYPYYCVFLFSPYLAFVFWQGRRRSVLEVSRPGISAALTIGGFAAAFAVCLPYIVKVEQLVNETVNRAGGRYEWSINHVFDLRDTVGSLVYPPIASFEGWYYFGIGALVLIVLMLSHRARSSTAGGAAMSPAGSLRWHAIPRVSALLLLWYAVITYITWGQYSYLFRFLYLVMPFFSHLQVWGRMNIILVPLIAWMLAMAYDHFEEQVTSSETAGYWYRRLFITIGVVIALQVTFLASGLDLDYWRDQFVQKFADGFHIPPSLFSNVFKSTFLLSSLATMALFAFLLRSRERWTSDRQRRRLLVVLSVFGCWELAMVGPWVWMARISEIEPRVPLDILSADRRSLDKTRIDPFGTVMLDDTFSVGTVWNWHLQRYVDFRSRAKSEPEAFRVLMGLDAPRRFFLSSRIDYPKIQSFLDDSARFGGSIEVRSYTGDELDLTVHMPSAGYVSFIDNWDPDWTASIDGQPARIELLFGTFKSLRMAAGEHRVRFAYRPKFF